VQKVAMVAKRIKMYDSIPGWKNVRKYPCRIIDQTLIVEYCNRLCNAIIGVSILLYILQELFEVSGQCFPALSCNIC
jgi:hypothetical protein